MIWYLVKTSFRKTIQAMDFYNSIDVECYAPCHNVKTSNKKVKLSPLLPGYVFVKFQNKIDYNLVNLNPFTKDVVVYNYKPIAIVHSQMQRMINHVESIYNTNHFSNLSKGDLITVNHGKLEGVTGTIIEIRNNKIYLNIDSLPARVVISCI